MVEQPPSSTTRELAEYLSRQFDRLTTAVSNGVAGATQTFSRLVLDGPWNAITDKGQLFLNGATGNRIDFNRNGKASPTLTTRSVGTKLVLNGVLSGTSLDTAIGVGAVGGMWFSNPTATNFNWYCDSVTSPIAVLSAAGNFSANGSIKSTSPTAGIGYDIGAGGTVTQLTSKSTPVTLNKMCGTIITMADSVAAGVIFEFNLNNSNIAITDMVIVTVTTSANAAAYTVTTRGYAAGVCIVSLRNNSAGALADALTIKFIIIKSVIS
jgi:hypothetical protein